jgi:hypothetical protein
MAKDQFPSLVGSLTIIKYGLVMMLRLAFTFLTAAAPAIVVGFGIKDACVAAESGKPVDEHFGE